MAFINVIYNSTEHRIEVPRTTSWTELKDKLHSIFSIPTTTPLTVSYTDEDGDAITLSSDLELSEVLSNSSAITFTVSTSTSELHNESWLMEGTVKPYQIEKNESVGNALETEVNDTQSSDDETKSETETKPDTNNNLHATVTDETEEIEFVPTILAKEKGKQKEVVPETSSSETIIAPKPKQEEKEKSTESDDDDNLLEQIFLNYFLNNSGKHSGDSKNGDAREKQSADSSTPEPRRPKVFLRVVPQLPSNVKPQCSRVTGCSRPKNSTSAQSPCAARRQAEFNSSPECSSRFGPQVNNCGRLVHQNPELNGGQAFEYGRRVYEPFEFESPYPTLNTCAQRCNRDGFGYPSFNRNHPAVRVFSNLISHALFTVLSLFVLFGILKIGYFFVSLLFHTALFALPIFVLHHIYRRSISNYYNYHHNYYNRHPGFGPWHNHRFDYAPHPRRYIIAEPRHHYRHF